LRDTKGDLMPGYPIKINLRLPIMQQIKECPIGHVFIKDKANAATDAVAIHPNDIPVLDCVQNLHLNGKSAVR
jgi:hypothetical protein